MSHPTIREQLADARDRSRKAQDAATAAKLAVKRRLVNEAGGWKGIGTNDKERELLLDLAVEEDPTCGHALAELRHWQAEVDRLQAELDDEIDGRRSLDRASRDRLSTALEALAIHAEERHAAITIIATPHAAHTS